MESFWVKVEVEKILGEGQRREIELLVDTRKPYSLVPSDWLEELGIARQEWRTFVSMTGRVVRRAVGQARFYYEGHSGPSTVIFGEEGEIPVLGFVTLAAMALEVDPDEKRLRRMPVLRLYNLTGPGRMTLRL